MKNENLSTLVSITKVFPENMSFPALNGIKIKDGTVTVTDLGIMVEVNMDMNHNGLLDHKVFCNVVTSIKDFKMKVDKDGNYTFSNKAETLKIAGYNDKDFPGAMRKGKKEIIGTLDTDNLKYLMTAVNFVGQEELRPVMNDVHCHEYIAATDAHMLYWKKLDKAFKKEVRFPARVCKLLKIIGGEFEVALHNDNIASCTQGDYVVSFRVTEGKYVNFLAVIPSDVTYTVEVDRAEFTDIVTKAAIYSNTATRQMLISIDGDKLEVLGEDLDFANSYEAEITPILVKNKLENKKMRIGLNAKILVRLLKTIEEETVTMKMSMPNKAVMINDEALIMPIMLNS